MNGIHKRNHPSKNGRNSTTREITVKIKYFWF